MVGTFKALAQTDERSYIIKAEGKKLD